MTSRNYGLTQRAGGPDLRGHGSPTRLRVAANTHCNSNSIPPLPAQSLRDEPVILDSDREIGATVFVIGFYAFIIASVFAIIKFLE